MESYKYNTGKSKRGLYCDVAGQGQAYNILLFLKSMHRNTTGVILVSTTPKRGYIKFVKNKPLDVFDDYYIPNINKNGFAGISLRFVQDRRKVLYLKVCPTKRKKIKRCH